MRLEMEIRGSGVDGLDVGPTMQGIRSMAHFSTENLLEIHRLTESRESCRSGKDLLLVSAPFEAITRLISWRVSAEFSVGNFPSCRPDTSPPG